jgi:hypothetical protein
MRLRATLIGLAAFAVLLAAAGPAVASAASPWWRLTSGSRPTNLSVGEGQVVVTAEDLGDAEATGGTDPIELRDHLPHGITAESVTAVAGKGGELPEPECSVITASIVACRFEHDLPTFDQIEMVIGVQVASGASASNQVTASGGGASEVSLKRALTLSSSPTPFGVADFEMSLENEGGTPDTQAGSHPFQFTTTVILNQDASGQPAALPRDLSFKLPPGLIGNPTVLPRCTLAQFSAPEQKCPPQSVMGVALVTFNEPDLIGVQNVPVPVYNLEPNAGEPARFGFRPTTESPVFVDTALRTGSDYGVNVSVHTVTQQVGFLASKVTLWGTPGASAHDLTRGEACLNEAREIETREPCRPLGESAPAPFMILPTSCPLSELTGQPESLAIGGEGDSWQETGVFAAFQGEPIAGMSNCNRLPFDPSISVSPGSSQGSTSAGLNVDVHVDQKSLKDSASLAQSAIKDITVALPEGVTVNPAGADGLEACSEGEVGFAGVQPGTGTDLFTPTKASPFCPNAAKVGTVEIDTPLLPVGQTLKGAVYIASQNENPFGSLLAMYMVAEDPVSGTLVKLPGEVHLTETGQIVTTFKNTPQVAFEDAKVDFFEGQRAAIATPARCDSYTTSASFVPWAAEPSDEAADTVPASSTFHIVSGPGGGPCPGTNLPFSPGITGGSTDVDAGAFTPVTTTISRADGQQALRVVRVHLPLGLAGLISTVTPCKETQANEGTCGPESLIGETTVSAGVGSNPITVPGGRVYITEPYEGAPFGLSIVSPVKAGPFDLEHDTSNPAQQPACDCIVVRAKIEVDPQTAELTVATDQTGPHAIPHIIDGIPVQIRKVNVTVNRPHFTFNPTNCDPLTLTGTAEGDEGATALLSSPFQVTNCAALKFTPKLTVTAIGKASKRNGTGLKFKIAYPPNSVGAQSNFAVAKFDIPGQLPVRLETIQQACLAAIFEKERAKCPAHSIIGHAVVHTSVLPVPLEGPVYFVSFGGAKFPSAVLVLKGDNVTIELHGSTFINGKTHVTSATFAGTPDVPFESVEVNLPSGPFGEFGVSLAKRGDYDLCGHKLTMPTLFKAQNGTELNKDAVLTLSGCPRATHAVRAQKSSKRHSTKHKKAGR